MEIYKLKDNVPNEKARTNKFGARRLSDDAGVDNSSETKVSRVTELKQGVKNPNRVNVFVDGKFAFSLDVAQVVDLGVKVGMELSEEKKAELKKASEFGKLYQRTLEWVLVRPRSERETRDYLRRKLHRASSDTASRQPVFTGDARLRSRRQPTKDSSEALLELSGQIIESPEEDVSEFSQTIIERLISKGYLNDTKFAEWYVENRFVKKGVSRKRLVMELRKKGVSGEIIDGVLGGRDDREEIQKMIARKRAKYDDEKLMAYLCRQGFSYDLVREELAKNGELD
ncbi:MAG: RecX family transcriptional regulator [Candidatus Saccharibacteria bacterium]|nr:RecX family transcriptional regulator [Candidatus Saccharibacteria bacterium]